MTPQPEPKTMEEELPDQLEERDEEPGSVKPATTDPTCELHFIESAHVELVQILEINDDKMIVVLLCSCRLVY